MESVRSDQPTESALELVIRLTLCATLVSLVSLLGCQSTSTSEGGQTEPQVHYVAVATDQSSGEPNLFVSESGDVYLSWIEESENGHQLRYTTWEDEQWGTPQTITRGSNWFVNWADFPSLAVTDSFAVAHWLQKSAEGTYDYDVKLAHKLSSQDQWQEKGILHQDGVAAEHGFVTLLPLSSTQILSVWLDGRQTKQEGGAMNLYANIIESVGIVQPGQLLDDRVCDCCQTDAALTPDGPIVVYRNRTEDEIRDIYVIRRTSEGWSQPYPLHNDGWQIAGCPVNGPAISTLDDQVAVAWFTAVEDLPKVQVVFSEDCGKTFGEPIIIDQQSPLGRVDIEMIDQSTAVVSWLEGAGNEANIRLMTLSSSGNRGEVITLANVSASRSSGFPIIAQVKDQILCAWTESVDDVSKIQTAWISVDFQDS